MVCEIIQVHVAAAIPILARNEVSVNPSIPIPERGSVAR
jgi:hypothetical protein